MSPSAHLPCPFLVALYALPTPVSRHCSFLCTLCSPSFPSLLARTHWTFLSFLSGLVFRTSLPVCPSWPSPLTYSSYRLGHSSDTPQFPALSTYVRTDCRRPAQPPK
ncbi:hypothetical protein C8Q73DRAFT_679258 [Cubamyces lactineus]|nr:hypothetical protein C8Q73DRAFT_679258 [Cubamyces lactineus]